MDELAGRYLTLCLRLSRLVPGLVDWYAGPERLLAAVHAEPRRLPERLATEADRLAADVASEATLPTDRADWLTAQLVAVRTVARVRAGDALTHAEHVRHVLGIEADGGDERRLESARRVVEDLLPGRGPLRERVARYRRHHAVPGHRTVDLFAKAVALTRPVAHAAFRMPDDEYLSVRTSAAEEPLAQARPDGTAATRIDVAARPALLADLIESAGRLTYPGHHTIRVLRTSLLVDQFGRGECTLELRTSPARVAAVGTASVGLRALLPPHERELLLDRLADAAHVRIDARQELLLHDALTDLDEALPLAARRLHDGDDAGARDLLERYAVATTTDVEVLLEQLGDRDVALAATVAPVGRRLVLDLLAKQDDTTAAYRRLVTEQLTPAALASGR